MAEKEFDLKDNFKRRYAGLVRIKSYIQKWKIVISLNLVLRKYKCLIECLFL